MSSQEISNQQLKLATLGRPHEKDATSPIALGQGGFEGWHALVFQRTAANLRLLGWGL